jgi:hypothetical protein
LDLSKHASFKVVTSNLTLVLYTKKVMEKVMKSAEKKLNLSSLLKSFTFPNFWVLTHRPSL